MTIRLTEYNGDRERKSQVRPCAAKKLESSPTPSPLHELQQDRRDGHGNRHPHTHGTQKYTEIHTYAPTNTYKAVALFA